MSAPEPSDADLEHRFEAEIATQVNERGTVLLTFAALTFPLPFFNDLRMFPERWRDMLLLRLLATLACLLLMAVNKSALGTRRPQAIVLVGGLCISLFQTFLHPMRVAGSGTLYFSGHLMVLVGTLGLLPLSLGWALTFSLAVHACFAVPLLLLAPSIDPVAFSMQNSFMVMLWGFLCIACHLNYQSRRREFQLRVRLYRARPRGQDAQPLDAPSSRPGAA